LAAPVEHPEEHLPEEYKRWFWERLVRVTVVFFILWTVIAIWWHIPAPHAWRNVLLFGNMPLHWYLAAFISIWAGVLLIFVYHALMSKVDDEFRARALEGWDELPEDVKMSLRLAGATRGGAQRP
jgi:putative solute:sodium symporter small subunit